MIEETMMKYASGCGFDQRDTLAVLQDISDCRRDVGQAGCDTLQRIADSTSALLQDSCHNAMATQKIVSDARYENAENAGFIRMEQRDSESRIRTDVKGAECAVMREVKDEGCSTKMAVKDNAITLKDAMFNGFLSVQNHLDHKLDRKFDRVECALDENNRAIVDTKTTILAKMCEDENQRLRDQLLELRRCNDHHAIVQSISSNMWQFLNNSAAIGNNQKVTQVGLGNSATPVNLPTAVNS